MGTWLMLEADAGDPGDWPDEPENWERKAWEAIPRPNLHGIAAASDVRFELAGRECDRTWVSPVP